MVMPTPSPTPASSIPALARIRHVHPEAADFERAAGGYQVVLGSDRVLNLGIAAFVPASGYLYHIGLNAWESKDVAPLGQATDGRRLRPPTSLLRQMAGSETDNRTPIGDDWRRGER